MNKAFMELEQHAGKWMMTKNILGWSNPLIFIFLWSLTGVKYVRTMQEIWLFYSHSPYIFNVHYCIETFAVKFKSKKNNRLKNVLISWGLHILCAKQSSRYANYISAFKQLETWNSFDILFPSTMELFCSPTTPYVMPLIGMLKHA